MKLIERIFRRIIRVFYPSIQYADIHFGQEGEDVILSALMEDHSSNVTGFYVDIGAHHPWRFSNTYLFYRRGWRGLNVDATPGSMNLFKRYRTRDINVEAGLGKEKGTMNFYCFNEPALNTFDETLAQERNNKHNYKILNVVPVSVTTLANLLDQYVPKGRNIDFMTVDVEGLDLEILKTNNWAKYRPTYLLVEAIENIVAQKSPMLDFLTPLGYQLVARTQRTMILKTTTNVQ